MVKTKQKTLKELDINRATFYALHGVNPEFEVNNGRVVFVFPVSDEIYKLMDFYNSNVQVNVLDFVTKLKELRGKMLTLRGGQR